MASVLKNMMRFWVVTVYGGGAYPSLDQKGKITLLISLHGGLYTKLDAPSTTYHSPVTTGYHLKQPSNLLIYDNLFAMFN